MKLVVDYRSSVKWCKYSAFSENTKYFFDFLLIIFVIINIFLFDTPTNDN